jgi:hypothetical protein
MNDDLGIRIDQARLLYAFDTVFSFGVKVFSRVEVV